MKMTQFRKDKKSHTVKLGATPEQIFPLLCPVREEEWTSGWENDTYELIYSESGFNEEGCIFQTSYPDGNESLWICTKHDKQNYEVEFLVCIKDIAIRRMNILLETNAEQTTDAKFEYTVTALSEKGNAVVDDLEAGVIKSSSGLGMMINHYLHTGTKLNIT
ncbi:MAG: hypothetical protein ABFD18_18515 [Syntrophomonas sp.]